MPQVSRNLAPFLSVAAGIAIFSAMDALIKSAAIEVGVYNAMLWRCVFGAGLMLPVWRLSGGRWPAPAVLAIHVKRGAVVVFMAMLFFWGLVRMPMAEAMALSFISPLIALYLAAVLLKERIRASAVLASIVGLGGVGVIAAGQFNDGRETASIWALMAVLISAVFYAWNLILQRQQALLAGPREVALFQSLVPGAILVLAAPWLAIVPPPPAMTDIAGAAVLTATSLMLLSWGYARAQAQDLVPLEYTGFVWAALLGWLLFDESVTLATLGGTVLILFGCWIALRKPPAPLT